MARDLRGYWISWIKKATATDRLGRPDPELAAIADGSSRWGAMLLFENVIGSSMRWP